MFVVDIFRIEFGRRIERIDARSPNLLSRIRVEGPKPFEAIPVCEVGPKALIANNPEQRRSRDVFDNRFLAEQL